MTTSHVILDELDQTGVLRNCTTEQARELQRTNLVEVRPEGAGIWRLLPSGTVGAVRVGDLQVQVLPKEGVRIRHLLFLLGYARDPGFRPENVSATADDRLWPALAESMCRAAERALVHGVLQGYRTVDDTLRTVRGRIRISDQMSRHPGMMLPLEVTYDEFTVDTAENRLLRTALRKISQFPEITTNIRRRLMHLDARLEGVNVLPPGSVLPSWLPTRLNERYQPALNLAEVVLRHMATRTGPGGLIVASFVVSMWKVFEDFVTTALTRALSAIPGSTQSQYRTHLDSPRFGHPRGDITMAPDIVHTDVHGRARMVYDAKYKMASPHSNYSNADYYQMLAYCTALQLPAGWLIFARGHKRETARQIRHTNITVNEFPLDLAVAPSALLEQVDELALRSAGIKTDS